MAGLVTQLREAQADLSAKQATVKKVWEEAGPDKDFSKVKSIEGADTVAKLEKLRSMDTEMNALYDKVKQLQADVQMAENHERREKGLSTEGNGKGMPHSEPGEDEGGRKQGKSFGDHIVETESFKKALSGGFGDESSLLKFTLPVFPSDMVMPRGVKTLFQTSAGWAPESTRTGLLVDYAVRPIQVIDLIPAGRTGMAAVVYMEETTRTNAAAERSEGGAYAESTFALTQRSSTVRSIGTSIPVTDEQLADVPMVQGYLSNRLIFGCRQRLDGQLLTGDGSAPNLTGINNASNIQTQAKGADPTPDTFYKAMTKIKVTGRAFPSAHVMHPNDWQDIRLLRTSDGIYIWGNPSEAGPMRLWGLPVVDTDAQTEGTGLTGDFSNFCQLFERQGVEVEVGYVNTDFTDGKKRMRAGLRVAFIVTRGAAFCQSTGI